MAEVWAAISEFLSTYETLFRVLVIIAVALIVNLVLRFILRRGVRRFVQGVKKAQAVLHTTEIVATPHLNARAIQRVRTLGTIGRHIITWVIFSIAFVLVLSELGVNLTALLASAGIVAAGLAFGAQNIIKDILNGIFMVFEDQLGVGDWVSVGEVSGTVEDVGIRVTQLRGIDGTLWFVRNGEILTLGNSSQGWGRALIDITVDAVNDMDAVERVTLEAAREVATSTEFRSRVVGEPELWGVESAHGDRATFRLALQTRPMAQWAVQRGLRSTLVRRFSDAGITLATELPRFPGGAN